MYEERIEALNQQLADELACVEDAKELDCTKRLLKEYQNSVQVKCTFDIFNKIKSWCNSHDNLIIQYLFKSNIARLLHMDTSVLESIVAALLDYNSQFCGPLFKLY